VNKRLKRQGTQRKQLQETEVAELISELDQERERRLKSEQAMKRLVDIVKNLQQKASEDQRQQESAIARLAQFRQTLIREKEDSTATKKQCEELQAQVAELQQSLDLYCDKCERQEEALRDTEKAASKLEAENLQQQATMVHRLYTSHLYSRHWI
jgi:chromosome segregation ATPase